MSAATLAAHGVKFIASSEYQHAATITHLATCRAATNERHQGVSRYGMCQVVVEGRLQAYLAFVGLVFGQRLIHFVFDMRITKGYLAPQA